MPRARRFSSRQRGPEQHRAEQAGGGARDQAELAADFLAQSADLLADGLIGLLQAVFHGPEQARCKRS